MSLPSNRVFSFSSQTICLLSEGFCKQKHPHFFFEIKERNPIEILRFLKQKHPHFLTNNINPFAQFQWSITFFNEKINTSHFYTSVTQDSPFFKEKSQHNVDLTQNKQISKQTTAIIFHLPKERTI